MKFDFVISPSEEAKICLNCRKKRCFPNSCTRYKRMKDKLKQRKTTPNQKIMKAGGNFKNEGIEQVILPEN